MNSLEASVRDNKTKGQLNTLKKSGNVPAIIYGGKENNQKVSISKKLLKSFIEKENFLSSIIQLNINGKSQDVLPKLFIKCDRCDETYIRKEINYVDHVRDQALANTEPKETEEKQLPAT